MGKTSKTRKTSNPPKSGPHNGSALGTKELLWVKDPNSGLLSAINTKDLEGYRTPVHLGRQVETELLPSAQEALVVLAAHILPLVETVRQMLKLTWVEHVYEESTGIEHVVIPAPFFEPTELKRLWLAAGYSVQQDKRQFASQDGLQEALRGGADLGKKWH